MTDIQAIPLIGTLVLLSLIPFIAIMTTSFIKLAVVFSLLRNALGIQQIPPNMALYGLAIVLSIYIMAPVGYQIADTVKEKGFDMSQSESLKELANSAINPMSDFLTKHSSEKERGFFLESAETLWPKEYAARLDTNSMLVLVPSFTISELKSAFEIGFLLYLPFIAIDLIVSNILLAMGMMMVSPMTISLPFKLLLFVLLDGWTRLTHGLVLSYQ
ncbi:EscR/YscR/HrcR family type III secretion system export apparatus protein [Hahella sp. KA22]|uniref:type III secretion system export apparatus subunit SctR n=1 Tax=Hahella sp. KA22 TaxID=1628392 RepID=UPI000FDE0DC6|nr:type III secretion system export apparatus subunit SctR [Hahella sp. KA22]AZZ91036.1 EscR/YscR/HrcR family type III secretion system export apparatus protein [Hahella sp. KA22]QAY54406.1 EscR/YscR/HrcR family type III secretion system export apparatus protein [Hahella sp. KA22]